MLSGTYKKSKSDSKIQPEPQEQKINTAFKECGFHPYTAVIEPVEQISDWLLQLFKSSDSPTGMTINQNLLCEIACGIIEEATPSSVLEILGKIYYLLGPNEQLACLYLAKEFIHQDTHCEWIVTNQFSDAYYHLLDKIEVTSEMKMHLKATLIEYYKSKLPNKLIASEVDEVALLPDLKRQSLEQKKPLKFFVSEVSGLFCQAMLSLSPEAMLTNSIMKSNDDKPAWKNITVLSSQLSHLVCLDILSVKDMEERARRIEFYIAAVNLLLNNKEKTPHLTPAYSIYLGICQNPVTRLKATWTLINEKSRATFATFEELFQMSNGFSKVRQYIKLNPSSMPFINCIAADKDKISFNSLGERIFLYGKMNHDFIQLQERIGRQKLASSQVTIGEKLKQVTYDEAAAYRQSYCYEPPIIIVLNANLTKDDLLNKLQRCFASKAPLVAQKGLQMCTGLLAKTVIAEFSSTMLMTNHYELLGQDNTVSDLCGNILDQFGTESMDDMLQQLAALSLEARTAGRKMAKRGKTKSLELKTKIPSEKSEKKLKRRSETLKLKPIAEFEAKKESQEIVLSTSNTFLPSRPTSPRAPRKIQTLETQTMGKEKDKDKEKKRVSK
ncbi:RasGEF domain-containing protein [Candidatus Berkiella aquae]|uniref:RasGEF domain protein n=1 Tax=Candidatus Berkiella aquae TaxID=295108 RepID=A0A0Q9YV86_9GAMM|nr:RasGEF domain-containing protein [Candidatus Berkiella aquae]MCS5711329.1 hypothetical protein [Candidatus Berkiella aquae]